jgi:branched-chain amino acid aminotransferase
MTTNDEATTFAASPNPAVVDGVRRAQILEEPGFGRYFTDHMVVAEWFDGSWTEPKLLPYSNLALDPAAMVLHYGQAIFEGLKAYRHDDRSVKSFRPDANAHRFAKSAARMAMPALPEDMFLGSLEALVKADVDWVPVESDKSLYLRPFMFSTEVGLGVRPANRYLYVLVASPAGTYFKGGVKPVSVWLSEEYVRAAQGGTGAAKFAGNYAASLLAQSEAIDNGCDQVVWLDAQERRYIEEMGGMNLFFVKGSGANATLFTPSLTGTLLPGITRESILTLGQDLGYRVEEGRISVQEWQEGTQSGEISETFACGTAAVITPVGRVAGRSGGWSIGDGTSGPITMQLREELVSIQTGHRPDNHNWLRTLVPPTS